MAESPQKETEDDVMKQEVEVTKDSLIDNKDQQAEHKYQIMIELLKRDVANLEISNRQELS